MFWVNLSFKVDGKQNPKIQTTHFPDFPVRTAHFSSNGGEFIVASNKAKHFYVYDLSKAAASRVEIPRYDDSLVFILLIVLIFS